MLRIVHLSDIHLAQENIKDYDNFVIKALKNDLEKFHAAKKIDMIILSGDLIDKGGMSFDDINSAYIIFKKKVIDAISEKMKLSCNQIFIIPGNHDIERNADDEIDEAGLCSVLSNTVKVNKMIESGNIKGIKRIMPYKKFEAEFYKEFKSIHKLSNYQSCFKMEIGGLTIGITCFNTAWRCYNSKKDKGNIILGEMQITDARGIIDDCDLKIGVVHHAPDWLAAFESKDIASLIDRDYDMLFCGHVHDGSAWSRTNLYGTLFVSIAPTNWSYDIREKEKLYNNGYAIIDYDFISRKIIVSNRRYSFKKECYDPNTELGNECGVFECTLPSTSDIAIRSTEMQLMSNIKNSFFDVVNEHLLTYDTDTKAPKDIDGIFVLPRIVENINYDVEEEKKENVFNLEDMYGSTDNIILFGAKESGKTVLLDKMLKDLTTNIQTYHISPVLFNFNEVGNRRYETIISSFLGMSIHDVGNYLNNNEVVLLIDNLSFDEFDKYRLKNLIVLINNYPKIRILATCRQVIQGNIIPLEMLTYEAFHSFRMFTIESFRTKQIRELILKWFSNQKDFDIADEVEKLVNFVLSLNLPRTPLAISMLLWIIEQQENYKPINNATMLENFVERLFKKLAKHEIYSYEFDYRNKERLLTDIAFEMYRNGTENYRLKYIDLYSFIDNYLKLRKFEFEADKVLNHFLAKGILITENDDTEKYVRFRFACFFQYFLTKKMDFDKGFKEYVLKEQNTLQFINEIDYYTGLKRDQSDILRLLVNRMTKEYSQLLGIIDEEKDTFDSIFMGESTIIESLDETFTKTISDDCKPPQEELDNMTDELLDVYKPGKEIKRKEVQLNPMQKLGKLWTIAAMVLKNTEEIDTKDLKVNSYRSVLRCSMAFAFIYRMCLGKYLKEHESDTQFNIDDNIDILRRFLPLIHQLGLYTLIGTSKLSMVVREKINEDSKSKHISDFERFISIFLYADIKGKSYEKYVKKFLKDIQCSYIYDMVLFKILTYYFLRSKTKGSDALYLDLIADLIVRSRKLKKDKKGTIITEYKKRKRKSKKESGTDIAEL